MLDKMYSPKDIEDKSYSLWEQTGSFSPQANSSQGTFALMMPPPNVTGSLHMGHALNYTLQDVLVRYYRMRGFKTLWQPGTDHAGIATQMMVERQLSQEGLDRKTLGREKFLERVWQWKEQYGHAIVSQQRRLGLTPDWSRQRFTLDEGLSNAVKKVFVNLYQEGLLYRDKRPVNWDPVLLTAVSDLEVKNIEHQGHLWYINYKILEAPGQCITIATSRPETLFGDSAIAVHPDDERYQHLIGKHALVPFIERSIPIIGDSYSDPTKGTGAVKITPAHDFNDFEVGERHGLERFNIFDERAHLCSDLPAPFGGLERFKARQMVVDHLTELGHLNKVEPTLQNLPYGERSDVILEPRLTDQWFIATESLAKEALKAVHTGKTRLLPENLTAVYDHWMTNIRPWCISRQLWWGHQIPAWYGPDGTIFVAESLEEALQQATDHYGRLVTLRQDEDVLDTWFSSALWPFSTLGWPQETEDLKTYYPTSCLITGTDILFFWVARMIMMGVYIMKKVPFKDVYLHALVRDAQGQKMSKTKGNVVDPLEVMETYGTDALRFTLTSLAAPGRDIKYSNACVESYRNFATKLWNAARYLEMQGVAFPTSFNPEGVTTDLNRWILSAFTSCALDVEAALKRYRFDEMASTLYQFAWGTFCDWYVEFTKPILYEENSPSSQETKETLGWVFGQLLHLLHPIMPFITEELWGNLAPQQGLLITRPWPTDSLDEEELKSASLDKNFSWVIELISSLRGLRNEVSIPVSTKFSVSVLLEDDSYGTILEKLTPLILRLARLDSLTCVSSPSSLQGTLQVVLPGATLYVHLKDVIDLEAEKNRLQKALQKAESDLQEVQKKLTNQQFIANAPADIVQKITSRFEEANEVKQKLLKALERLKSVL